MHDRDLAEAVARLYAIDCGLAGPTGNEAALRDSCRRDVWDRLVQNDVELGVWISRLVRDLFLAEPALAQGHGIHEAYEFWSWFEDNIWSGAAASRRGRRLIQSV